MVVPDRFGAKAPRDLRPLDGRRPAAPGGLILPPGVQSSGTFGPAADRFDKEYGGVYQRSEMSQGDILDSEILQLEAIFKDMQERYRYRAFNVEEFEHEAKERCHSQLGLAIAISWKKMVDNTGQEIVGAASPRIEIVGRVDKKAMDHDRKVHEVTRDILDLGTQGVLKSEDVARGGHPH
ncbi:hypothetical protein [Streptomyces griseoaurantiacus]|uniref:hypothetical protein n=1 Tax=Streptomyces griseoaurantiacus TaxID=68213 RepID=UPI0036B570CB